MSETPSAEDLQVISGYLIFAEGVTSRSLVIESVHDVEGEDNEVFVVKLLSASKHASVSHENNLAILTGSSFTLLFFVIFFAPFPFPVSFFFGVEVMVGKW